MRLSQPSEVDLEALDEEALIRRSGEGGVGHPSVAELHLPSGGAVAQGARMPLQTTRLPSSAWSARRRRPAIEATEASPGGQGGASAVRSHVTPSEDDQRGAALVSPAAVGPKPTVLSPTSTDPSISE